MIKMYIEGAKVNSTIKGSLTELMAESIIGVATVYEQIKEDSKSAADEFKYIVTKAFEEGVVFDSTKLKAKTEEIEKKAEELQKEQKEKDCDCDDEDDEDDSDDEILNDLAKLIAKMIMKG